MKKLLLITLFLGWAALSFAAKVDTLLIKSPSMNKDVKVVVVTPDVALGKKALACPVLYLLHGYGGNAKTWIGIKPNLPQIADEKGMIFVCPDGKNSGTGIVRSIRHIVTRRSFHRSWLSILTSIIKRLLIGKDVPLPD